MFLPKRDDNNDMSKYVGDFPTHFEGTVLICSIYLLSCILTVGCQQFYIDGYTLYCLSAVNSFSLERNSHNFWQLWNSTKVYR